MSRHSSFSRSSAPPTWRTMSKPAVASVSLVFAEPEHAVPVGSATAILSPRQQQSSEMAIVEDSSPRRRRPSGAASSLRRASLASLVNGAKHSPTTGSSDTASVKLSNGDTDMEAPSTSSPTQSAGRDASQPSEPSSPTPPQRTSQRTGWFSSLGRKSQLPPEDAGNVYAAAAKEGAGSSSEPKGLTAQDLPPSEPREDKDETTQGVPFPASGSAPASELKPKISTGSGGWFSSRAANSVPTHASIPEPLQENVTCPPEDTRPSSPPRQATQKPSPPQDIPQRQSTGWFTSSGSPATIRPAPTPNPSAPSSVDDSVPILSSFSPLSASLPSAPLVVAPRERTNSNLSSLNPSSSRFTLSMPLLGRPKVPLDQLVIQAERAGAVKELPEDMKVSVPPVTEKPEQSSKARRTNPPSETSSWWGYLGVGSSSSGDLTASPNMDAPSPVMLDAPEPESNLSLVPELQPAASVRSAETNHTRTSTWYTPWRWYGEAAAPAPTEVETAVGGAGKTQAEIVKEEALARPERPVSTHPTPRLEPSNPVMASAENRASWVSFFASRSVNVKSIEEKGEAMEVMNLDDDDDVPIGSGAGSGPVPDKKPLPPPGAPKLEQEPPKRAPNAPPLTKDDAVKRQASRRPSSPSSKKSVPPIPPRAPNLVLPTFEDTFGAPPRSIPIPKDTSTIRRTIRFVSEMLFPEEEKGVTKGKGKDGDVIGKELPRTWGVLGEGEKALLGGLKGTKRVVVIGIHGWFPGSIIRQVLGEPTGTSGKFASMMGTAVEDYFAKHGGTLEKLTKIVLEGEGTIERRVNNLYQEYLNHEDWVEDLQRADAILCATHSQGSIVSTQFLDRLISEGHIRSHKASDLAASSSIAGGVAPVTAQPQRVCCLAMCGIHLGPLLYLNTSSLVQPYLQYFESAAARELFEFQDSESQASQTYMKALNNVLEHGTKFAYIASLDDQVVPIYSGSFTTATHPLILRALYIDGDAYSSSDFLSNLLVLLLRIRNAGLDDGGLITHLSEATAGSLSGVGHSSAYEEPATYALAVRFLFETSGALGIHPELEVQPFTARAARNDYEIPWALRDVIANPEVAALFASEFAELRAAFDDWHPRTSILRDIRRKLEPIRRLPKSRL